MSFADPGIAELFSSINLDFVAIDMEHTSISLEQAKNIISNVICIINHVFQDHRPVKKIVSSLF